MVARLESAPTAVVASLAGLSVLLRAWKARLRRLRLRLFGVVARLESAPTVVVVASLARLPMFFVVNQKFDDGLGGFGC